MVLVKRLIWCFLPAYSSVWLGETAVSVAKMPAQLFDEISSKSIHRVYGIAMMNAYWVSCCGQLVVFLFKSIYFPSHFPSITMSPIYIEQNADQSGLCNCQDDTLSCLFDRAAILVGDVDQSFTWDVLHLLMKIRLTRKCTGRWNERILSFFLLHMTKYTSSLVPLVQSQRDTNLWKSCSRIRGLT